MANQKMTLNVATALLQGNTTVPYTVTLLPNMPVDKPTVTDTVYPVNLDYLEGLGLNVLTTTEEVTPGLTLIATGLDPAQVSVNTTFNDSSALTTRTSLLRSTNYGLGSTLSGQGVTVGVWDASHVRDTHQEFTGSRVTFGDGSTTALSDHSTHVAGTIGADGDVVGTKGMAPLVAIKSYDWTDDMAELNLAATVLSLSNHSYGMANGWNGFFPSTAIPATYWWMDDRSKFSEDPDFGLYTTQTQTLDTVLHDNPNLLSVWAAGNDRNDDYDHTAMNPNPDKYVARLSAPMVTTPGWYLIDSSVLPVPGADGNAGTGYDSLPPMQTAKNSLVVGAVNDVKATAAFSNWGPTDDGRIGVQLMADGVDVYSPIATNDTAYGTMSGTSMAAPNVTGAMALLYELHNRLVATGDFEYKNVPHISTGTQPRFQNSAKPTSATMKGLVLHTAFDLNTVGPDYQTGYGLLDAKAAGDFLNGLKNSYINNRYLLAEDSHQNGYQNLGKVNYSGGLGGVKVTLVWNDPAPADNQLPTRGTSDATIDNNTKVLVNDLDLYLQGPDGKFYYPWHLNPSSPSSAATSTSTTALDTATYGYHVNNIEQVVIPESTLAAGDYSVNVIGNVNSGTSQDFSIFVTAVPNIGQGHGWGDVHLQTFDGQPYEFQAAGEFVFIESTQDDWQIQTRQALSQNWIGASVNTAFATTMDGYKIVFDDFKADHVTPADADYKISIDGHLIKLASGDSLPLNTSLIERYGNTYTFTWAGPDGELHTADDDRVTANDNGSVNAKNNYIDIYANPANYRAGYLTGLLGNADGDAGNDFTLRNGIPLSTTIPYNQLLQSWGDPLLKTWADSWHLTLDESLFETRIAVKIPDKITAPTEAALDAAKGKIMDAAGDTGGIIDDAVLKAIALDFLATGGKQVFIDGGVAAFAQAISLEVSPADISENDDESLIYTFTRTGDFNNEVTVNYTVEGTAQFGNDYTQSGATSFDGTQGTVTFAQGSATATVTLAATSDMLVEGDETIEILLTPGENYTIDTTAKVTGTIWDKSAMAITGTPVERLDAGKEDEIYAFSVDKLLNGFSDGKNGTLTIANLTATHGTISPEPNAGILTFVPDANYNGTVSLDYDVTDGILSVTANQSFELAAVVDPLSLEISANALTYTDTPVDDTFAITTGTLKASDIDNPNSVLTYGIQDVTATSTTVSKTTDYGTLTVNTVTGDYAFAPNDVAVEQLSTDVTVTSLSVTASNGVSSVSQDLTISLLQAGNTESLNDDSLLMGTDADDQIDGLTGKDGMQGGLGNDTYTVDNTGDTVIENPDEGIDQVNSSVTYALNANVENLTLTGVAANNGTGNLLNNKLVGNIADNMLDGSVGADSMSGGLGNDTYLVDNSLDLVSEAVGAGTDQVNSSLSYILNENVENLTLTGTDALNATGNALANILSGNNANNALDGSAGADSMIGGLGDDTYLVDNSSDAVSESTNAGTDTVNSSLSYTLSDNVENLTLTGSLAINATGNTLANALNGNSANNLLDGKFGADTMSGGLGNDTYLIDNVADQVNETANAGTDTVNSPFSYTLTSNVENLVLNGINAINGTGNAANNSLYGNSANNILDGGVRVDYMSGSLGNDTYLVDNMADSVIENVNAGTDTVNSSVTYSLPSNVENLTLTGTATINGTGNTLNNTIVGNTANNVLNGGLAADYMSGGLGNDTYFVDSVADTVVEAVSAGIDQVNSSVSYVLSGNVENLTLIGTATINGTGNAIANILYGNSAANSLSGSTSNDTLVGGGGKDILTGGTESDTFKFIAVTDSTVTASDIINDFVKGDRIDLAAIDAKSATPTVDDSFTFIGSSAFSAAGQVRFSGGFLYANVDSNLLADFAVQLTGVTSLLASDLTL